MLRHMLFEHAFPAFSLRSFFVQTISRQPLLAAKCLSLHLFVGILFSRRFRRQRCITLSFAEDSNGVGLTSPRIFSSGLQ
jgi:hypothetical protein